MCGSLYSSDIMDTQNYVAWIFMCTLLCAHYVNSQVAPTDKDTTRTVLKVAAVESTPFVNVWPDGTFDGLVPDLLKALEELTPYNFSLYLTSDKQYGALENGTWTGMMAEVISGTADLAVPLTVTQERNKYVDFTVPLQTVEPVIVLKRPNIWKPHLLYRVTLLLAPMTYHVWLGTILAFFVTSTVLYLISRTNPYEWRRMAKEKEATLREGESFTCMNSFWFVISTLAWQGYSQTPRSLGGRIVVTAWWFFVLIFIVSYTASLTNLLKSDPNQATVPEKTIKSYTDLIRSNINVAMISGGTTAMGFRDSDDPVDSKIYKKFEDFERIHKPLRSLNSGLRYVREAEYAMIMESPTATYFVNRKPCDLYMINQPKTSRYLSIAVAKSSSFLKDINDALLSLYGEGRVTNLQTKWISSKSECDDDFMTWKDNDNVPKFHALDLGNFSGALLILVLGLVFGGIVSAIEVCIYKKAESQPDESRAMINGQPDLASSEVILGDSKAAEATHV